jgi:beta-lactamase regulating signal transducer with metallopeptidase domain
VNEALLNHLWQSTLFACAAALLMLAFRSSGASVRFKILLAASLKFLLPFSILVFLGEQLHWGTTSAASTRPQWSVVANQFMQPASLLKLDFEPIDAADTEVSDSTMSGGTSPAAAATGTTVQRSTVENHWNLSTWGSHASTWILMVWLLGCIVLLGRWLFQWMKLRAVVAVSAPLDIEAPIPVRETATTFEPGVCGILAPIVLLPRGVAAHLTSNELDAVLEHELCHWWRRDNLLASLHMLVEALFWFHPLVWWLGSRLVVERERACDEEVIGSGTDRQAYAEGILKVCRFYVTPPLLNVTGVSGGSLRQRIEDIMTYQVSAKLHLAKKCLLSAVGLTAIAGPLALGLALGPQSLAQAQGETAGGTNGVTLRHYHNTDWNFGLDVPTSWNRFPPLLSQSPNELMRFVSSEQNVVSIYRSFFDAQKGFNTYLVAHEDFLQKKGDANFRTGQATLGSRQVVTLEYTRPTADGTGIWSFRQYFLIQGTVLYLLSFATPSSVPDTLIPLQDRIAQSFTFDATN